MFFIGAILIGILLGYLCRGRVKHLVSLKLRFLWLVGVALLLQLAIFPLFSDRPLLPYATTALHFLSYGLVFLFLFLNRHVFPFVLIGLGSFLNLLVIIANGGYMPSSPTALERAGAQEVAVHLLKDGVYGNVELMSETTRLNILGDFLYFPGMHPFAAVFSIGDLILALGLIWLIARGMRSHA